VPRPIRRHAQAPPHVGHAERTHHLQSSLYNNFLAWDAKDGIAYYDSIATQAANVAKNPVLSFH
jgi:hypothetical protein